MTWEVAGITHTAMLGGWELRVIGSGQYGCRWDVTWIEGGTVVVASGCLDGPKAQRAALLKAWRAWLREQAALC